MRRLYFHEHENGKQKKCDENSKNENAHVRAFYFLMGVTQKFYFVWYLVPLSRIATGTRRKASTMQVHRRNRGR